MTWRRRLLALVIGWALGTWLAHRLLHWLGLEPGDEGGGRGPRPAPRRGPAPAGAEAELAGVTR